MVSPHILLVEDSDFMATHVSETLEEVHGFYVTTVATASDALETLAEYDDIECVVTNYELPEENGVRLAGSINGEGEEPNVPVILLTAKKIEPMAGDALHAGVSEFVFKGTHATGEMNVLANRIGIVRKAYLDV